MMFKLAGMMTKELKDAGYTLSISETHHVTKQDAPSGTALTLRDMVQRAGGLEDVAIRSIRQDDAVGLHVLEASGPDDKLLLTHESNSRRPFAEGAVRAAEWLTQAKPGVYDFREIFTDI